MIIGNLTGNAKLPIKETLAEVVEWGAEHPLDNDVVFCAETKSFFYYNESQGGAIDIGIPIPTFEKEVIVNPGETEFTDGTFIYKTILGFFRDGIKKKVVTGAALNPNQIGFTFSTGKFSLYPGEEFGDEYISVIYSLGQPPV